MSIFKLIPDSSAYFLKSEVGSEPGESTKIKGDTFEESL